jgi:hypothetical protein
MELLTDKQALSGRRGEPGEVPQDAVHISVEPSAHNAIARPTAASGRGSNSTTGSSNGGDCDWPFYSLWSRPRATGTVTELPDPSSLLVRPADTGIGERIDLENDKQVRHETQHGELWTRGVDPADVDILKGTLGQAVVLGRGALGLCT